MDYNYFRLSEFDSPDLEGSGEQMNQDFVQMLDMARAKAGIPFKITSGFRTREHNNYLLANGYKASPNSSHLRGCAADISATSSAQKYAIVTALLSVGINRIGIASNFIHADIDPQKPQNRVWTY